MIQTKGWADVFGGILFLVIFGLGMHSDKIFSPGGMLAKDDYPVVFWLTAIVYFVSAVLMIIFGVRKCFCGSASSGE